MEQVPEDTIGMLLDNIRLAESGEASEVIDTEPTSIDEIIEIENLSDGSVNLLFTLDISGSMANPTYGGMVTLEDGTITTRFEIAKESMIDTINNYGSNVDVNLTLFNADGFNAGWMNSSDAVAYIEKLSMPIDDSLNWDEYVVSYDGVEIDGLSHVNTDYKDAIDYTMNVDFADHTAENNVAFFISDGKPTRPSRRS